MARIRGGRLIGRMFTMIGPLATASTILKVIFRVLYAGSTRLVCFLETLARYRKPAGAEDISAAISHIKGAGSDYIPARTVPASWLATRTIGSARLPNKQYADVYSSEWLSHLRRTCEGELLQRYPELQTAEFDLATLLSPDRSLTKQVATLAYRAGYAGIRYHSRHGSDQINWALFEPFESRNRASPKSS